MPDYRRTHLPGATWFFTVVSHRCRRLSASARKHRESTLWQRRYWEHRIRDQRDFNRHADYIHYNPVKHGLVAKAADWPYSTLHRQIALGVYSADWGVVDDFGSGRYGE